MAEVIVSVAAEEWFISRFLLMVKVKPTVILRNYGAEAVTWALWFEILKQFLRVRDVVPNLPRADVQQTVVLWIILRKVPDLMAKLPLAMAITI